MLATHSPPFLIFVLEEGVFPVNLGQAELPKWNALSSEWDTGKAAALNVGTHMVMHLKMIF